MRCIRGVVDRLSVLTVGSRQNVKRTRGSLFVFPCVQGAFKDTTPDVLLAEVLSAVLARSGVSATDVGEVSVPIKGGGWRGGAVRRFQYVRRRQ